MNKSDYKLTKGQSAAWDILEKLASGDLYPSHLTWGRITNEVRRSGATVRNWMTIRSILQMFLDDGRIERAPFDPEEDREFYQHKPSSVSVAWATQDKNGNAIRDDFEVGKTYHYRADQWCGFTFKVIEIKENGDVIGEDDAHGCPEDGPGRFRFPREDLTLENTSEATS